MAARPRYTVLFDETCELCRRVQEWLSGQPTHVDLELLPAGSDEARRRYGSLPWLGEELVVVNDRDEAWVGPAAFLVAIWTTRRYRAWSHRLAGPAFAPMAERFFHMVSARRKRFSAYSTPDDCTYCHRPEHHRPEHHRPTATRGIDPWSVPR